MYTLTAEIALQTLCNLKTNFRQTEASYEQSDLSYSNSSQYDKSISIAPVVQHCYSS